MFATINGDRFGPVVFFAPADKAGAGGKFKVKSSPAPEPQKPALSLDNEELSELRGYFLEHKGRETRLSDEEIDKVVSENGEQEKTPEEWADLLEMAEPAPEVSEITVANIMAMASKYAQKANANAELTAEIGGLIEAGERAKSGPLMIMFLLKETYGDEVLNSWPVPGTPFKDKDGNNIPTNNPDRYSKTVSNETVRSSFYDDLTGATDYGRELAAIAASFPEKKDDPFGDKLKDYYAAHNHGDRTLTLKKFQAFQAKIGARQRALTKLWREAVRIHFKAQEINNLPHVEVAYVTAEATVKAGDKEVKRERPVRTPQPIVIQNPDTKKRDDFREVSVGRFLRFKVDVAKEKGGTVDALIESVKRPAKSGQGDQGNVNNLEIKWETLTAVGNTLATYMDDEDAWERIKKTARDPSKAGSDELLLTLGKLNEQTDAIMGLPGVTDRYKKLRDTVEAATGAGEKKAAA